MSTRSLRRRIRPYLIVSAIVGFVCLIIGAAFGAAFMQLQQPGALTAPQALPALATITVPVPNTQPIVPVPATPSVTDETPAPAAVDSASPGYVITHPSNGGDRTQYELVATCDTAGGYEAVSVSLTSTVKHGGATIEGGYTVDANSTEIGNNNLDSFEITVSGDRAGFKPLVMIAHMLTSDGPTFVDDHVIGITEADLADGRLTILNDSLEQHAYVQSVDFCVPAAA